MRVVLGAGAALPVTFSNLDGHPTDADDTPTCSAVSERTGTETALDVEDLTDLGAYRAILPAPDALDRLTVTWEATVDGAAVVLTDEVDVVGAHYASVAAIRARLKGRPNTATARLVELRDEFAYMVEQYRGESWTTGWARQTLAGPGLLAWPKVRTVVAVLDADDVDVADQWEVTDNGMVTGTGGPVTVSYEHGVGRPDQLRRACIEWVSGTVSREDGGAGRDVVWQSAEGGQRYSTASWGQGRPTGMIDVDAALNRLPDMRTVGVA